MKEGIVQKFIAVYSVWTNWRWIDKLSKLKEWLYIYSGSYSKLDLLQEWDIVFFIQTSLRKALLFTFIGYEEYENNKYIIINEKDKVEIDMSIADFKNLYFLNIDSLKSWVRSPLWYNTNLLIFNPEKDILANFCKFDILKDNLVNNLEKYQRQYIFTKNTDEYISWKDKILKSNHYNKIICKIENKKFISEYSVFNPKGIIPNDKYFNISFNDLKKLYWKQNLRNLDKISSNESFTFLSFPAYYDLTRAWESLWLAYEEDDIVKEEEKEQNFIAIRWESRKNEMLKIFQELLNNYKIEETRWLIVLIGLFIFLLLNWFILFLSAFEFKYIPQIFYFISCFFLWFIFIIIEILTSNKAEKNNPIKEICVIIFFTLSILIVYHKFIKDLSYTSFNLKDKYFNLLPFILSIWIFVYFTSYQYSKSKNLRIEYENRIAIMNWYLGLQDMQENYIELFSAKAADIVFSKAIPDKWDKNLPIDEILSILKLTNLDKK